MYAIKWIEWNQHRTYVKKNRKCDDEATKSVPENNYAISNVIAFDVIYEIVMLWHAMPCDSIRFGNTKWCCYCMVMFDAW